MRLATSLVCILSLCATKTFAAEPAIPLGHSVVNIVFAAPIAGMNQMQGGVAGAQVPRVRVGDMILPIDQITPISISIDKEFVGHAMSGIANIIPTFVLESGTYEFSFSCEGYKPVMQKIKVVGTGSKQYLVIQMQKEPSKNRVSDSGGPSSEHSTSNLGVTR